MESESTAASTPGPDAASDPGRRRKQLLINPKVQLTLIGFNAALALIAVVIFYFENLYLFTKFTEMSSPDLLTDPIIVQMIAEEQARMNLIFGVTALIVMITLIIGGLILSNRVAGPIYRIRTHMEAVIAGKTDSDVTFRDKDFFPELADRFNEIMKMLRSKS